MTRILALFALAALLALPACKKQEGPQVAFLLSTLQEERYQKDVKYFEARAKELGFRVVTLAADNDNAKQIAQVEDVLDARREGPRDPADRLARPRRATSGSRTRTARRSSRTTARSSRPISTTTSRTTAIASACCQAQAALAATGSKGKYVILSRPGRSLGRDRDHARLQGHARAVRREAATSRS